MRRLPYVIGSLNYSSHHSALQEVAPECLAGDGCQQAVTVATCKVRNWIVNYITTVIVAVITTAIIILALLLLLLLLLIMLLF